MRWIRSLLVVTALVGLSALATSSIPVCAQDGGFDECVNVQPDIETSLKREQTETGATVSFNVPGAIKKIAGQVLNIEPNVGVSIGLDFTLSEELNLNSRCECSSLQEQGTQTRCCPAQFDFIATTTKTVTIPELPQKAQVQQVTSVIDFSTTTRSANRLESDNDCFQNLSKKTTTFSSSVDVGFSVGAQFGAVSISANVSNDNLNVNISSNCNCGNPDRAGSPCLGAQPLQILDIRGPIVLTGSPESSPAAEFEVTVRDPNRGQLATRIRNADNYSIEVFPNPRDLFRADVTDKHIVGFNTLEATARVGLACPGGGRTCLEGAQGVSIRVDADFNDPNPEDRFSACDVSAPAETVPVLTRIAYPPSIEGLEVNAVNQDDPGAGGNRDLARLTVEGADANGESDRIRLNSASSPKGSLTPLSRLSSIGNNGAWSLPLDFTSDHDLDVSEDVPVDIGVIDTFGLTAAATFNFSLSDVAMGVLDPEDDEASTPEDQRVAIPVLANDTGQDLRIEAIGDTPPGAQVSTLTRAQGDSVELINFTPPPDFNGETQFTYTVSDGRGERDTATVTVNFQPRNDAPVANDDTGITVEEFASKTIDVLANDQDVDGDRLSILSVASPSTSEAEIIDGGRQIRVDPIPSDVGKTLSVPYTVDDGNGGQDTATVRFTVQRSSPIANDDTATTNENTPVTIDVLANDRDPNGDELSIGSSVVGNRNGEVVVEDGQLHYLPDAGFSGTETFNYAITDGRAWSSARVRVTVQSVNRAPTVSLETPVAETKLPSGSSAPLTVSVFDPDADDTVQCDVSNANVLVGSLRGETSFTVPGGRRINRQLTFEALASGSGQRAAITVEGTDPDDDALELDIERQRARAHSRQHNSNEE